MDVLPSRRGRLMGVVGGVVEYKKREKLQRSLWNERHVS